MRSIYEFLNYREYLADWIEGQGRRSHGLKGRMAMAMGISSSLLSQVLKGDKTLTPDQTSDLIDFMGLLELEAEYLHLLVEYDRAGNPRYRTKLQRKLVQLQNQSRKLGTRVPRNKELTDEQKAIYYSSWLYTGIRNLTAVPAFDHAGAIAERLGMEPALVQRVLLFLIENGLCRLDDKTGAVTYGPAATHTDKDSPFANKHHQNWRLMALQKMELRRESDVFFTSPMSLSHEAHRQIQDLIANFIQAAMKVSGPSSSETVSCLNIDWFGY